ncbi:MAG: hypothetical protein LBS19_04320 [Clostridiales bacterium]|nr:hypothetical protein [Clostridiales bacterium]
MTQQKHQEVFFNRAAVKDAQRQICEECFEVVVFALRDSGGTLFSVGLTTMLQCLQFAIENGDLPKLPSSWLREVDSRYDIALQDSESIWYDDGEPKWLAREADEIRQVQFGRGLGAIPDHKREL